MLCWHLYFWLWSFWPVNFSIFVCCWNSIFCVAVWSLKNSTNKYRRRQNGATEKMYTQKILLFQSPQKKNIKYIKNKLKYSEPKKNDNLLREKKTKYIKYKTYKTYKKRQIAFNVPLKCYIPTYIYKSIFMCVYAFYGSKWNWKIYLYIWYWWHLNTIFIIKHVLLEYYLCLLMMFI